MNRIKTCFVLLLCCCYGVLLQAQSPVWNTPGAGNPILPGYFADPTIKKFGDTYYIYATTDGSGAGFGPSQVWTSKDLVNWTLLPMNWPDSHWIWAPDAIQASNGKYYLFYCQPCNLYCGESETPRGPWKNIFGESEAVLVPDRFVTNAITLDGQTFVDDDGSVYLYWGTWGIYKGFGCGAGKLSADMKSFTETRLIPNTEATDFFEAPFVLKRNGVYYFMYSSGSCHDQTYRVQYATSKEGPLGPYTYGGCILETSSDGTIHGPGHHSILQQGDDYYMVYHRHNNPHSNRGFHRQICIDRMQFNPDGTIEKMIPTHSGIEALVSNTLKSKNLAFGKSVKVSSFYDEHFRPEYAVDDNNGTIWRPRTMGQEWIEVDLGKVQPIRTVWTQFEYGTAYYQYLIETSVDGRQWTVFADKRQNHLAGSPMVDFGKAKARFVRLTTTGGQKNGFSGAIWNLKIFAGTETGNPQQWIGLTAADWDGRQWNNNGGMLGGFFALKEGGAQVQWIGGREALVLQPGAVLEYKHPVLALGKSEAAPSQASVASPATGKHTFSALVFSDNRWQPFDADATLSSKGIISLKSSPSEPLILTNLRYYNWKLEPAELAYDAQSELVRLPAAQKQKQGLIVDIMATDFAAGDTIPYIPNHGVKGAFETQQTPAVVEEIEGRRAIRFDGTQVYQSNFTLPTTMRDNAPYTLEAWILNPELEENECVADFTTSHNELEKIMLVNGTEPRCGVLNHYGWYEDVGYKEAQSLAGKWQHWYVAFDGRLERVYLDGRLVSEKDIQLLVKPSQYITLGRNAERNWPFTGYLHTLKLYDHYLPYNNSINK